MVGRAVFAGALFVSAPIPAAPASAVKSDPAKAEAKYPLVRRISFLPLAE
jgi:hypothetical protein